MSSIRTLPAHLRPREKLLELGAENISDAELLAILLRSGSRSISAIAIANSLLQKYSLPEVAEGKQEKLQCEKGMSALKCLELQAGYEFHQRAQSRSGKYGRDLNFTVETPETAVFHCSHISHKTQENFLGLYLNGRKQLVHAATLAIGGLNMLHIHPREVFALALQYHATSVILAHNHPSGSLTASAEDIATTDRLRQAGELLGIEILDHLILTKKAFLSMREEGIM